MLDEQSFQGLLAAAFTIQQHNDRQKNDRQNSDRQNSEQSHNDRQTNGRPTGITPSLTPAKSEARPTPAPTGLCRHCGAPLPIEGNPCPSCGTENFRPGERLQRTWASMWLMSQEQNLGSQPLAPDQTDNANGARGASTLPSQPRPNGHNSASSHLADFSPIPKSAPAVASPSGTLDEPEPSVPALSGDSDLADDQPSASDPAVNEPTLFDSAIASFPEPDPANTDPASHEPAELASATNSNPIRSGLWGLRVKLRFHRADLYLGIAVSVAFLALLWPATTPQRPKFHPWERILIAMGIAEVPAAPAHFHGDPNLKVWVDTHTALYYCPGDELYGKSPDGHFSTQREAELDRFEPAERSACIE